MNTEYIIWLDGVFLKKLKNLKTSIGNHRWKPIQVINKNGSNLKNRTKLRRYHIH